MCRYSPSTVASKRSAPTASAAPIAAAPSAPIAAAPSVPVGPNASVELPEADRVGEWLTAVSPRKAPYHPQMGDRCVYFRLVS